MKRRRNTCFFCGENVSYPNISRLFLRYKHKFLKCIIFHSHCFKNAVHNGKIEKLLRLLEVKR